MATSVTEAEKKMQERLAAYKKKMEARKAEEAKRKEEEKRKKEEKKAAKNKQAFDFEKHIEEEKRKTQQKLEEAQRKREQKQKEKEAQEKAAQESGTSTTKSFPNKTKSNLRKHMKKELSSVIQAEHGLMMQAEKKFEQEENEMQKRLETYKAKVEAKKKEVCIVMHNNSILFVMVLFIVFFMELGCTRMISDYWERGYVYDMF